MAWTPTPGNAAWAIAIQPLGKDPRRAQSAPRPFKPVVHLLLGLYPDKPPQRIHPYPRWLFTRGFAAFSIALFVLAALIVCGDFTRIRQDTLEFFSFTGKSAYDIWIFWVLLFFVSEIHEFGHGLTCKHFGGEVHQMGFMLIYFTPAFYTHRTDMHMFDRMSKRLYGLRGHLGGAGAVFTGHAPSGSSPSRALSPVILAIRRCSSQVYRASSSI